MATVKFNLKSTTSKEKPNQKKPKKSLVVMIFNFGYFEFKNDKKIHKFLKYSTGISINPDNWNFNDQKVKATINEPNHPDYNARLNYLKTQVEKIYYNYTNDGISPTIEQIKKKLIELDAERITTIEDTPKNLFEFLNWYLQQNITHMPKAGAPVKINVRTKQKYKSTVALLEEYTKERRKGKLNFDEINEKFYIDFVDFSRTYRNHRENTIAKHVRVLKTLLKAAIKSNDSIKIDFSKFKASESPTEKVYLTDNEILKIYHKDLTEYPGLEKTRDLFIIGCYTALRYSDYGNIKKENLYINDKGEFLKIKTFKTGELVVIPIHPIVRNILDKYDWQLPKIISNQKTNENLKEVCKKAEINDIVNITTIQGGVKISKNYPKHELVSTHTGRRSAATNMFKSGLEPLKIMKITGHKTESAFMRYIQIGKEENAEILMHSDFFRGKLGIL